MPSLRPVRMILLVLLFCFSFLSIAQAAMNAYPVTPIHKALTDDVKWVNTTGPITANDLAGRIILLDFWTYCCINCMHVLPKLAQLEQEFGDQITVIGVHSAKFATEGDTVNIRNAIAKYGIHHPVINDNEFKVWRMFGVNAWPTLLLIGPNGMMKQVYRGEGDIDEIRNDIEALLKQNDKVVTKPLPVEKPAMENADQSPLSFPGKIALYTPVDGAPQLIISDSSNHRIVLVDMQTNQITKTIGSGEQGFADGPLDKARFDTPQGVIANGDLIFVADTNNHRLRQIDLKSGTVTSLAGNGMRGSYDLDGNQPATKTALASPWDLAFYPDNNHIAIANAGTHQLWSYNRTDKTVSLLAGNGRESIDDGKLPNNSLSQPSGLAVHGTDLYFVDSETSSLRVMHKDGTIETLIGTGLFDFGLKDGTRDTARMQHAIGLTVTSDGTVYIADTYNHKIRMYRDGQLSTLPIDDLKEPNDILLFNNRLYITDTNHNRIVSTDRDGKDEQILPIK